MVKCDHEKWEILLLSPCGIVINFYSPFVELRCTFLRNEIVQSVLFLYIVIRNHVFLELFRKNQESIFSRIRRNHKLYYHFRFHQREREREMPTWNVQCPYDFSIVLVLTLGCPYEKWCWQLWEMISYTEKFKVYIMCSKSQYTRHGQMSLFS